MATQSLHPSNYTPNSNPLLANYYTPTYTLQTSPPPPMPIKHSSATPSTHSQDQTNPPRHTPEQYLHYKNKRKTEHHVSIRERKLDKGHPSHRRPTNQRSWSCRPKYQFPFWNMDMRITSPWCVHTHYMSPKFHQGRRTEWIYISAYEVIRPVV